MTRSEQRGVGAEPLDIFKDFLLHAALSLHFVSDPCVWHGWCKKNLFESAMLPIRTVPYDSIICMIWLIHMRDMTYSRLWPASSVFVTWRNCVCPMTHSYVHHDSFICVTWLIHVCDVPHAYVSRDSLICATWLIHTESCYTHEWNTAHTWTESIWAVDAANARRGTNHVERGARRVVIFHFFVSVLVCVCVCLSVCLCVCVCVRVCVRENAQRILLTEALDFCKKNSLSFFLSTCPTSHEPYWKRCSTFRSI